MVSLRTARFNIQISAWWSLCVECFVRIPEQTTNSPLHNINCLVFITEMKSVYSAVRSGALNIAIWAECLKG